MTEQENISALLVDHAAGSLPEPISLVMATYVSLNGEARARYDALNEVGGLMLEDMDDLATPKSSVADLLARLDDDDVDVIDMTAPRADDKFDAHTRALVPAPLRQYLGDSLEKIRWRKLGAGVAEHQLPVGGENYRVSLLKIAPGKAVPTHSHRGMEYTVVLDGAFEDGEERLAAGDMSCHGEDHTHRPISDVRMGCLCLAVTDAPLKFSGPLGWVINPFLKH